ncbi:MAG: hypothetical protein KKE20_01155 [Nanoarchaeota archaeon]|nr:hypothetical protein [Nanoarchaeota archaeon]
MEFNKLFGVMLIILITVTFAACSTPEQKFQDQLDKAMSEKFDYSEFSYDGFTVQYPVWPAAESDVELSVSRGYCSVAVNAEKITAEQWFGMIGDAIEQQEGKIIISDKSKNLIRYSMPYQNFTMVSENRIYDCKGNGIAVTITCIDQAFAKSQDMIDKIFGSAKCDGKQMTETKGEPETKTSEQEKTVYKTYKEDDFSVKYPDWAKLQDNAEHKVGVSKGICSVVVDMHNALPKDIYNWYKKAINDNDDNNLLDSSAEGDTYYITYDMPYEDKTIISTSKVIYCNYQSYIIQVLCVEGMITEEYEEIRDYIIESSGCAKEYEIPTPEKVEEAKKEAEEEDPGAIEEIEDEIVKTNAGEEFGIDEEAVVYFINSNDFFTKIMKDFPKANIVIEDPENNRELDLRVEIDNDGKIELLEDGSFSDADVTLKVPLRDALNIFGNAQNINPLTLIGFAANVQTDPLEVKDEVIKKVLRGEYN